MSNIFRIMQMAGSVPNAAGDPYFDDVSILLHGDGTDGSTTFIDSSSNNHTITAVNDAQIDTSVVKYGTGSMQFDGNGDRLSSSNGGDLGDGDFTVEAWIYPLNINSNYGIVATPNTASGSWVFGLDDPDKLRWFANNTSSTINLNEWTHVAACRHNGTIRLFINGVVGATISNTVDYSQTSVVVGTDRALNADFNGYIDDLRITKGVARYTSDFTPPTAAFPDS